MFRRRQMLAMIGPGLATLALFSLDRAQAETPNVADIVIGEIERRILEDYFNRQLQQWQTVNGTAPVKGKKAKGLPPGLAKKGKLPPGLEKQLARNGHLPPGLEYRDLPADLGAQLPPLPADYRYVMADNRVMLIQRATNLILDVIEVAAIEALD